MLDISRDNVIARIGRENPWWRSADKLPYASMRPRPYLKQLVELMISDVRRAVILMGPRRVGKTVMLHHAVKELIAANEASPKNFCFISVDHPLYNNLPLQDFLDLYRETTGVEYEMERCFFIFDEIQYMRDWERHLKVLVDSYPNLKFVASGSAAAALKLKSNESGAGRFTDLLLPPLTLYEYVLLRGVEGLFDDCCEEKGAGRWRANVASISSSDRMSEINGHFLDYLNFGGYPEVALNPAIQDDPGRFIKNDIVDKVLLRDLPSLYGIENIQELNYLFTTLSYNTAGEVSLESLSSHSGVAKNTIKKYIEYLEAAFLIKTVNKVDINARRFKRATAFKVYLTNPSIRSALFAPLAEKDEAELGNLVETAVFSQWFHSPDTGLYYARWPKGELDMVYLGARLDAQWAIEVKWSDAYLERPEKLKEQVAFCKRNGLKQLTVTSRNILAGTELDEVEIEFVPAALYCYALGRDILNRRG